MTLDFGSRKRPLLLALVLAGAALRRRDRQSRLRA